VRIKYEELINKTKYLSILCKKRFQFHSVGPLSCYRKYGCGRSCSPVWNFNMKLNPD
jgi:hypothetical protein